jgi:hypothetical protein
MSEMAEIIICLVILLVGFLVGFSFTVPLREEIQLLKMLASHDEQYIRQLNERIEIVLKGIKK